LNKKVALDFADVELAIKTVADQFGTELKQAALPPPKKTTWSFLANRWETIVF
jgi:hypothetical protein